MSAHRWTVERSRDDFEVVIAESVTERESGSLRFYNGSIFEPKDVIVIAHGQWITYYPEATS